MNHFFALELSSEARQTVHESAEQWRSLVKHSSWYDPADYHITLKFLGDVDEAEQPRLTAAAAPIAAETEPLMVQAASFGGFPNMRAPSVLWAGVQANRELDRLAARLEAAMVGLGLRTERRRYQPHITVARCRLTASDGLDWPLPPERLFVSFPVKRFVLMQTRPGEDHANRTGLRYNIVHTFPCG